jgi:hypothetical protein
MARRHIWLLIAAVSVAASASLRIRAQTAAQPIPPGFDFPADEARLLQARDANDVSAMRTHAWLVFAGMTAPTASGEPVWETWHSAEETFRPDVVPPPLTSGRPLRTFRAPRQLEPPEGVAPPPAPGQSLASFTLFNEDLKAWVHTKQLHKRATLKAINDGFGPGTPVANRKVPDFPNKAIAVKTVWWIVRQSGFTPMPIWDPPANPGTGGLPVTQWRRCVAVDAVRPTIPAGETANVRCNGRALPGARVVPLSAFYSFRLTQAQITAMRQSDARVPNLDVATPGDSIALVGFHFTTREIPDWVWATLWWHDAPDQGPFAADRPAEVKGAWRNYLMAESYSMDTPKEADGSARIAYNPWLEAGFGNGIRSNCMTCHRRAVFSGQPSDFAFLPVTRGAPSPTDPRFTTATTTDFLWSVLMEVN